jgi:uncharacterized alkaline shock family protein YloU
MTNEEVSLPEERSVPHAGDGSSPLGDIKINHSVVANIVRLATLEVEGVDSVGGGFMEGITEIFSKKDSDRGVRVTETESGNYALEVKVVLCFGYDLSKTGLQIQQNVAKQIQQMTMKTVERIDVTIEGVRQKARAEVVPTYVNVNAE